MYKKTIAGLGEVDMSTEEISEREAEESLWEIHKNEKPIPTDHEILLKALEQKVGITEQDKLDAATALGVRNVKG